MEKPALYAEHECLEYVTPFKHPFQLPFSSQVPQIFFLQLELEALKEWT